MCISISIISIAPEAFGLQSASSRTVAHWGNGFPNSATYMVFKDNLTGRQFGRLLVTAFQPSDGRNKWGCKCSCGKTVIVARQSLINGATRSCGCLNDETRTKHGGCKGGKLSATYRTWDSMIQRCTNANSEGYKYYGSRCITVPERWLKYENFLKDMGERPQGKSIERIDNNKGYGPDNCKWASRMEQVNNRRNTIHITIGGETRTAAQWADIRGMERKVVYARIKDGWEKTDAILTPIAKREKHTQQIYLKLAGGAK